MYFSPNFFHFKERSLKANVKFKCDFIFIKTKLTQKIYSLISQNFSKIVVKFISVLVAINFYGLFLPFITPILKSLVILAI